MRIIENKPGYLNIELSPRCRITRSESDGTFLHWPNGGCRIHGDSLNLWLDSVSREVEFLASLLEEDNG